jgi:hypothetical protein
MTPQERMRARRISLYAMGLTNLGQPRTNSQHPELKGLRTSNPSEYWKLYQRKARKGSIHFA